MSMKTRRSYDKKAFTLVEVIVAAVVFAGAAMLSFAAVGRLKLSENVSVYRLNAALMAKKVLDGLSKDVNAQTWSSGNLTVGTHGGITDPDFPPYKVTDPSPTASYVVSNSGSCRKVVITVTWTAPTL